MKNSVQSFNLFHLIIVLLIFSSGSVYAQAYPGYTLYSPNNSRWTYLRDMNNQLVNSWYHNISGGYSSYLLPDSSVLRSAVSTNSSLNGGGATGIVQKWSWNATLLWQYTYSTNTYRTHHDIEPLPNGNVLLIAWEVKTATQCTQAGLNHSATLWPDHIIEVQPVGTNGGVIVWKWHFWDHLIQDYDPTKSNYGVVGDHPELLDINCGSTSGDWTHINGISYNSELDQIVISSHNLDEIYVIDHSTTTAEAASHQGGNSGRGGDILYRWGRPSNYDRPGSQVFNVVHSSVWITNGLPGAGNIMAFNNREGQGTSMIVEIEPPYYNTYNYYIAPGQSYGPTSTFWSYTASGFYSNHLGGCQRLPNGNTLIAESTSGYLFEVNSSGTVVWSYSAGGEVPRVLRYPLDYLSGTTTFQLSVNVANGWNMVSVPGINPDGQGVSTWWAGRNTLADVYKWDGTYTGVTTATPSEGYWMLHTGSNTYNTGEEWPAGGIEIVTHDPIPISTGWNMIGGYENSPLVSGLTTTPAGLLVAGTVYGWNGSYFNPTNLEPGYGYWLLSTGDGVINPPTLAKGTSKLVAQDDKEDWGKITITDAADKSYVLYAVNGEVNLESYQLPPLPPEGLFDVRFGSGRIAEDLNNIQSLEMRGTEYPINISVENLNISMNDESGKEICSNLKPGEKFTIRDNTINKILVYSKSLNYPKEFTLGQNYPNPFNPTTSIEFYTPAQSYVQLKVYDVLGNEVAILVDETIDAGNHVVNFYAENLSSGVYYYKLIAGDFIQSKKMLLLK